MHHNNDEQKMKKMIIKGRAVLKKKSLSASILDGLYALVGKKVSFHLVSVINVDPANNLKGKIGKPSYLEEQLAETTGDLMADEIAFKITFAWDKDIAVPGALIVRNQYHSEVYLKNVTLEDVPSHGKIQFNCNSWVYPVHRYQNDRIFFTNKAYLPHQTPGPLRKYREEELAVVRGNGKGKLEKWDRVYDYAYYNDLGSPEKGSEFVRPIYGGSTEYPYPRRGRTGRPPTKEDPETESRLGLVKGLAMYVPRDERFSPVKMADFLADAVKSVSQIGSGFLKRHKDKEFESFQDVLDLFEKGGIKQQDSSLLKKIKESIPSEFLKALVSSDGAPFLKYPLPDVIKEDKSAWRTDEEFAREMLSGIHPIAIRRLEEFPPVSDLNPKVYGNQNSSITKESIEHQLNGLTVDEAINENRMFILDHHDTIMPFLKIINTGTTSKVYATRTLLFLKDDGTLNPLAIELSLPHQEGDEWGAVSKVYTPAQDGVEGSIWQLAKAFVAVTDSGYHQLISHWLNTHAVMEPFIIATNRQLSVLHPIYKLLHPHLRDTMNINAIARQIALNANGLFEKAVFPGKYAVEWTSKMYKDWVFTDQALPKDLIKRGMAVEDSESLHGHKLLIEDYPYAVDGLEIWSAIESWVKDYCSFYYTSNDMITNDTELQSWWTEIREVGHGDKKDEQWWPQMKTFNELTQTCTTIIWIASALHAAVNFGQYPYAGYMPNRPTISRELMPEPNTPVYEELKTDPDRVFLRTVTSKLQTLVGISLIELLSRHSSDEVYLGERDFEGWTSDEVPLEAFERFGKKLVEIEDMIVKRNCDEKLKNRAGPAKLAYTLLYPSSGVGLTGRGIPNSIST